MKSRPEDVPNARSWLPGFLRNNSDHDNKGSQNERTSLLPKPADDESGVGESYDFETEGKSRMQVVAEEFWILFKGSIPVIFAYALQNSLQTVSVLIVGRLSPESLSTAAFCYMFAMATAWLIGMGVLRRSTLWPVHLSLAARTSTT